MDSSPQISDTGTPPPRSSPHRVLGPWALLLLSTALVAVIGLMGLTVIERQSKEQMVSQLRTALSSSIMSLRLWASKASSAAESWSNESTTRGNIVALATAPGPMAASGESSEALRTLTATLEGVCRSHGFPGYVIVRADGLQIASSRPQWLGRRDLAQASGFVAAALEGRTVVSAPFAMPASPRPVGSEATVDAASEPAEVLMFAAAPVRDDAGHVVAVLAVRLDAGRELARVLQVGQSVEASATYLFNRGGMLLTDTPDDAQLRRLGLIRDLPGSTAALQLELRDPGVDLTAGSRPAAPRDRQPLTRMADSATSGRVDRDIDGYRDHRGVRVVGAWRWLSEFDAGIAHEIEYRAGYASMQTVRVVYACSIGLLLAATLAGVALHSRAVKIELQREAALKELLRSEARFRTLCDSAPLGIFECAPGGRCTYVNPFLAALVQKQGDAGGDDDLCWRSLIHSDDRDAAVQSWRAAVASGGPWFHEHRLVAAQGDRWVQARAAVIAGPASSPGGIVGIVEDITDIKLNEQRILAYQERLRKLSFESALAEERERRRIAADLHDRIGQALALTQIKLTTLRQQFQDSIGLSAGVSECIKLVAQTVADTRTLTFDLSPPVLYDLGFEAALQWLAESLAEQMGLEVEVRSELDHDPLTKPVAAMLFRAVRELLLNVVKHAGIATAGVTVTGNSQFVRVEVEDRGAGFDPDDVARAPGYGLFSVREQMTRLGGGLEIESSPGAGTRASVWVLVPDARPENKPVQSNFFVR